MLLLIRWDRSSRRAKEIVFGGTSKLRPFMMMRHYMPILPADVADDGDFAERPQQRVGEATDGFFLEKERKIFGGDYDITPNPLEFFHEKVDAGDMKPMRNHFLWLREGKPRMQ